MNKKGIKIMRKVLREGTWIRLSQGELYKITGTPVGEGGGPHGGSPHGGGHHGGGGHR